MIILVGGFFWVIFGFVCSIEFTLVNLKGYMMNFFGLWMALRNIHRWWVHHIWDSSRVPTKCFTVIGVKNDYMHVFLE